MQMGLVAEFEVPAKDFAKFIAAARQEVISVRENEPGCLRFDVIVFDEAKGHGAFVEIFADQAAVERHQSLPHFKEFFDSIRDIDVKWRTHRGRVVE